MFFLSGSHPGCHINFWLSYLLQLLWAVMISQIFLIFDDFKFWRVLVRYYLEYSSIGICLMFFSWLGWSYGILEEDHTGKVPLSSQSYQGCILPTWPNCWSSPWSPGFSTVCQISPLWSHSFLALSILYSLESHGVHTAHN